MKRAAKKARLKGINASIKARKRRRTLSIAEQLVTVQPMLVDGIGAILQDHARRIVEAERDRGSASLSPRWGASRFLYHSILRNDQAVVTARQTTEGLEPYFRRYYMRKPAFYDYASLIPPEPELKPEEVDEMVEFYAQEMGSREAAEKELFGDGDGIYTTSGDFVKLEKVDGKTSIKTIVKAPKSEQLKKLKRISDDFFKTGFPSLDRFMGGGIRPGSLTTIYGPPGTHKNTICKTIIRNQSGLNWDGRIPDIDCFIYMWRSNGTTYVVASPFPDALSLPPDISFATLAIKHSPPQQVDIAMSDVCIRVSRTMGYHMETRLTKNRFGDINQYFFIAFDEVGAYEMMDMESLI